MEDGGCEAVTFRTIESECKGKIEPLKLSISDANVWESIFEEFGSVGT